MSDAPATPSDDSGTEGPADLDQILASFRASHGITDASRFDLDQILASYRASHGITDAGPEATGPDFETVQHIRDASERYREQFVNDELQEEPWQEHWAELLRLAAEENPSTHVHVDMNDRRTITFGPEEEAPEVIFTTSLGGCVGLLVSGTADAGGFVVAGHVMPPMLEAFLGPFAADVERAVAAVPGARVQGTIAVQGLASVNEIHGDHVLQFARAAESELARVLPPGCLGVHVYDGKFRYGSAVAVELRRGDDGMQAVHLIDGSAVDDERRVDIWSTAPPNGLTEPSPADTSVSIDGLGEIVAILTGDDIEDLDARTAEPFTRDEGSGLEDVASGQRPSRGGNMEVEELPNHLADLFAPDRAPSFDGTGTSVDIDEVADLGMEI